MLIKNIIKLHLLKENNQLIDKLLDKINKKGKDSLTDIEIEYLDSVYTDKPKRELEKKIEITTGEHIFVSQNKNIPPIEFELINSDFYEEFTVHEGYIFFDDFKFEGHIICDAEGDYDTAEFNLIDGFDDYFEVGTDLFYVAEGIEHEIQEFFINEVCPNIG